jgi:acyl dehydratase
MADTTEPQDWMYGKITDEALAAMRVHLGALGPIGPESDPYTRTQIIRYLASVGDDNPLYWDEDYAAGTRWKGLIAPPRLLLTGTTMTPLAVTQPPDRSGFSAQDVLQGVFAMISGTRMVFERPVRLGDRLRAQSGPFDVIERQSRMAGRSVEQVSQTTYFNQKDEVVATVYGSVIRMERGAARKNRKYLDIPPAKYTDDEIEKLDKQYKHEGNQRRGSVTRYWDDTNVGDSLITLAKGPLSITDIVSYFLGQEAIYYTNRIKHLQLIANPAQRLVNTETNIEDEWTAAHWDEYFARLSGIPRPYDEGPMRYDNLTHLVTDWMGDDGLLREISVTLRMPNLVGDISLCTGNVAAKRVEDGRHLVDLMLWITNQRGEKTTLGTAIVELPKKQ